MEQEEVSNRFQKVNRAKSRIVGPIFGLLFAATGGGVYYLLSRSRNSWSPIEMIKGGWLIPLLFSVFFFGMGVFLLFLSIFGGKEKMVTIRVADIEQTENGYIVIFSDDSIPDSSFKSMMYKYFIYETEKDRFKQGDICKINLYKHGVAFDTTYLYETKQARALKAFSDDDFEITNYSENITHAGRQG